MVHNAHDSTPPEDRLDRRVRGVRLPGPSADLLGRCLGTIPTDGSLNHAASWLQGEESPGARIALVHPAETGIPEFTGDRNVLPIDTSAAGSRRSNRGYSWLAPIGAVAASALVAAVVGLNMMGPARENIAVKPVAPVAVPSQVGSQPASEVRPAPSPASTAVAVQPVVKPGLKVVERKPLSGAELAAAQMDAGEFGPAFATIKSLPPSDVRDHLLAQMAGNQNNLGQMAQAMRAAGLMGSGGPAQSGVQNPIVQAPLGGGGIGGASGGGPQVDFQSLIDLVRSSTTPRDSWDDQGGPGTIAPFRQGVFVDAAGVLHRQLDVNDANGLAQLRQQGVIDLRSPNDEVRTPSPLRKVSLTRLERMVQERALKGLPPTNDMAVLAGLQRIEYVFIYPETGDLCVAGPAGDWKTDAEGRQVSVEGNRPVVLLDDLVSVLRFTKAHPGESFGCTIDPRRENLAAAQNYINEQGQRPLPAGEAARKRYVEGLREKMGKQDVSILGPFDATTHAAAVLVEADYRMKLVGVGLEDGGPGLPSTFDMLKIKRGDKAPDLGIFRLWFTMNYDAVEASNDLASFHLRGQAVQVQTEDGVIGANGQKVFLGKASALHQEFAHNFTKEFENLALRYPVYGQLRNVFDAALVSALIHSGDLAAKVGWEMSYFGNPELFPVERRPAPAAVDTVVNYKVYNESLFVTQVSGGVDCNPWQLAKREKLEIDSLGRVGSEHDRAAPNAKVSEDQWWWD
ncbi:MAG TPA: DUF1598 domain-containing protein [Pirellulales bacterium]